MSHPTASGAWRALRPADPGRSRPEGGPAAPAARASGFPNRYRISRAGSAGILRCTEAPTLTVRLARGRSVTLNEALRHPPGTIFLDGAAQAAPFLYPDRGLYNLDHHEGCVRAFTLATCEQAMVLMRKRVDLRRRDWTIHANGADLDTVLAVWILLNHLRLSPEESEVRPRIMPLVRLEGSIDALGVDLEDLCALAPETLRVAQEQMRHLRARELELKADGRWERIDLALYMADRLQAIDRLVYQAEPFEGLPDIEELARAEIAPGRIAIVCRSDAGVYEVERELRRIHGERLALFALRTDAATYTLRQMDATTPAKLDALYAQLNLVDPAAGGSLSGNRWGGSDEIGGSPRRGGTRLSPHELVEVFRRVHLGARGRARLGAAAAATAVAAALTALLARGVQPQLFDAIQGASALPDALRAPLAAGAWALLAGALLLLGRRRPGLFGLRRPAGGDAWRLLPLACLGAAIGGAWWPGGLVGADAAVSLSAAATLLLVAVGIEAVFRGEALGILATQHPIQRPGGRWFVSVPVLLATLLYTAAHTLASSGPPPLAAPLLGAVPAWLVPPVGAALFGLALGLARERSESVLVPMVLHALGLAMVVAGGFLLL